MFHFNDTAEKANMRKNANFCQRENFFLPLFAREAVGREECLYLHIKNTTPAFLPFLLVRLNQALYGYFLRREQPSWSSQVGQEKCVAINLTLFWFAYSSAPLVLALGDGAHNISEEDVPDTFLKRGRASKERLPINKLCTDWDWNRSHYFIG